MFCSKCGKTVSPDAAVCPACGAPQGENRFGGTEDYTSVQFTIAPGQKEFKPVKPYTRTSYTDMPNADQEDAPVDSRTTYRPVYEGASAPSDVRRNMRETMDMIDRRRAGAAEPEEAAPAEDAPAQDVPETDVPLSKESQTTLGEIDEDLGGPIEIDREAFKARPITLSGPAGISQDVSDYIRKMEDEQSRKTAARRKATPVYDDYVQDDDAKSAPSAAPARKKNAAQTYEDDEPYEDEDAYTEGSGPNVANIIKIAIAVIIAAVLVFGVVRWIGYIRGKQSSAPIEGVSGDYYEAGLNMIKSHTEDAYISERKALYSGGMLQLNSKLTEDVSGIKALMPEEPAANDSQFQAALLKIQDNIGSAILMDALAAEAGEPGAAADSADRWQIIDNSIVQLESARSAAELTAITNGETITVVTTTPAPTVAPETYNTLQKGDESNDVLRLQNRLYELGYLNDTRDGAFGSKTQTAVKLFQQTAGLETSGIADSATQQRLYADDAPYAPGAATPTPGASQVPVTAPQATIPPKAPAAEEAVDTAEADIPEGAEEI